MIVIPMDMWPHGAANRKYPLMELRIVNKGTGDVRKGNYLCTVYSTKGGKRRLIRQGHVNNWPRMHRPLPELIIAALTVCGYDRRIQDIPQFPVAKPAKHKKRTHTNGPPTSESSPRDGDVPSVPGGIKTPE